MANTVAELIFIPSPGLGHITSAIEIAKVLVNRDHRLAITVLVIKPPTTDYASSTAYIEQLSQNTIDRIYFIQLPQDDLSSILDTTDHMTYFTLFIESHCKYVRNAVADFTSKPGSNRVAGFVIDMFCTCMIDVANEFNVPTYVYFTCNASVLRFQFHMQTLNDDMNEDVLELSESDTEIPVPCFVKPFPTKLFWDFFQTREGLDFVLRLTRKLREVKAIMVNTFLELETYAFESLSADVSIPPVYSVGPVLNLEGGSGGGKLFEWLDDQTRSSVVFLCFGSMGSFDEAQVKEIARGLEQSGHHFLWSLRRPSSDRVSGIPSDYDDPREVLPEGFMERTSGKGKVVGWAPQVAVLAHPAVGGFVTHCGWNSMLESLWFGVPSATWPMYAEQQMNAFEMVVELGLAVEIKLDYKRDYLVPKAKTVMVTAKDIECGVRRVMEDNKVRRKVKETSEKSRLAVKEGGSSYVSVGRLIEDFVKNVS